MTTNLASSPWCPCPTKNQSATALARNTAAAESILGRPLKSPWNPPAESILGCSMASTGAGGAGAGERVARASQLRSRFERQGRSSSCTTPPPSAMASPKVRLSSWTCAARGVVSPLPSWSSSPGRTVTSAERKVGKGSSQRWLRCAAAEQDDGEEGSARLGAIQGGTANARPAVASRRRRRSLGELLPMWLLAAWALCCFPVAGGASYGGGGHQRHPAGAERSPGSPRPRDKASVSPLAQGRSREDQVLLTQSQRVAQGLLTQCLAATGAPVRPVPLCRPNSSPCAGCQEVPPTGADHHQIRTAAEIQQRRCCLALGGWKIPFSSQGARGALRRAPSTGAHFPNSSCSRPDRGHDSTNAMLNPILSFRMYSCFLGFTRWCSVWSRVGGFPCVEARVRQLGIRREMISDESPSFIYRLITAG